ncbi:delta and Notch-like epidermal growth factor-related receptor [Dreissena polymorpha]|uniref:TIR domain-containing protein n=1 Tax=Dreissena polymorpha TaxID=45954 RepID=A0A9D3YD27_DREPO|nr:delta and Notch-like epidermal growth factor-related receptor [Dreissena polymorpha]KAH3696182.1 hypothetical protein DPMN_083647 [Dreissena polymorpha]
MIGTHFVNFLKIDLFTILNQANFVAKVCYVLVLMNPCKVLNVDVCSPTYIKRPESERSCNGYALSCEFGVCIEGTDTIRCECDLGASGQLCEQRCCRDCGPHGSCRVVPGYQKEECHCDENYTGVFCESPIHMKTTSQRLTERNTYPTHIPCKCVHGSCYSYLTGTCNCYKGWTGTICDISCTDHCDQGRTCEEVSGKVICIPNGVEKSSHNACSSDYVFRPEAERSCMDILYCTYGTCVIDVNGFSCMCDFGVSPSQRCEHKCCKECGGHRECIYNAERKEELCYCDTNYKGSMCEIYNSPEGEKVQWWFYLLVTLIPILVMTLLTSLFLMYLWKRRVIVVLKAVRLFQAYDDDDERQWDAFISYRSNTPDEDYVIQTLFPKLTRKMGFNVNVHYKDFIPGNEITNNIIYAVENSRRTILVISPHYLASNFTKMEWQLAQQKMLECKNKIIPILLEDISSYKDTIDPNLKSILDSVTYIEWPGDQSKKVDTFWQRINLSMPKLKKQASCYMRSSVQNGGLSQPINLTNENSENFNNSFELDLMTPRYDNSVPECTGV